MARRERLHVVKDGSQEALGREGMSYICTPLEQRSDCVKESKGSMLKITCLATKGDATETAPVLVPLQTVGTGGIAWATRSKSPRQDTSPQSYERPVHENIC